MKILIPGDVKASERVQLFKCSRCECLFEASEGEYKSTSYWGQIHDALPPYICKCPTCSGDVYSSTKRAG